jgi:hypothetical protein
LLIFKNFWVWFYPAFPVFFSVWVSVCGQIAGPVSRLTIVLQFLGRALSDHYSASLHLAYISLVDDILDEIQLLGNEQCTKYQITQINGDVQIPTAIIMQKGSRFYKPLNLAAISFQQFQIAI